jgi:hypothetical protein
MIKVTAVQGAPNYLELTGTLGGMRTNLEDGAGNGCQLIAFREVYVAGYPCRVWLNSPVSCKSYPGALSKLCGDSRSDSVRGVCNRTPLTSGRVHDQFTAIFPQRARRTHSKQLSKMGSVSRGDEP